MNLVVILILAAVWAIFLVPQLLRVRAERVSSDSIGAFRRQLSVLERTGPPGPVRGHSPVPRARPVRRGGGPVRPPLAAPRREVHAPAASAPLSRAEARKRRRDILVGLLAAAGITFLLAAVSRTVVLVAVHLLLDIALGAYVALLVRARNLAAERDMKVHFLPGAPPEPALLLRRSAN